MFYLQVVSSCWSAGAQNQFQTQFKNFDVLDEGVELPRGRSAVSAAAAPPPQRSEQTTTPVPILKQINE
jgi:hypothetical protein